MKMDPITNMGGTADAQRPRPELPFGRFLGITRGQVVLLVIVAAVVLAALAVMGRPLLFASVDPEVAAGRGVPLRARPRAAGPCRRRGHRERLLMGAGPGRFLPHPLYHHTQHRRQRRRRRGPLRLRLRPVLGPRPAGGVGGRRHLSGDAAAGPAAAVRRSSRWRAPARPRPLRWSARCCWACWPRPSALPGV
nr:metal ABC transporter permease [Streptomyces sp. A012304]